MTDSMGKDLKVGWGMLKNTIMFKSNAALLALFTVIGFVMEFTTKGENIMGVYFMAIIGLYVSQFLNGVAVSEMVQSSHYKRALLVDIPTIMIAIIQLVEYCILAGLRYWYCAQAGEVTPQYTSGLLFFGCFFFMITIYNLLVYRVPVAGYGLLAIIIISVIPGFTGGRAFNYTGIAGFLKNLPICNNYWYTFATGLAIVIIDVVVFYILSRILYKVPLSTRIWKRALERQK
jgi:hypothetical protein